MSSIGEPNSAGLGLVETKGSGVPVHILPPKLLPYPHPSPPREEEDEEG